MECTLRLGVGFFDISDQVANLSVEAKKRVR